MRFPLSLTRSMTAYLLRKKLAGQTRFPLVLMLEPLFACNLRCAGCGRVREYADAVDRRLSVGQCLAAVDECGAPVVSVCGGEPLIYPELAELLGGTLARRKHVYLCTNGVALADKLHLLPQSNRLFINVHLDGMDETHDAIVGRKGVFAAAVAGIKTARAAGFLVCTNTTVYKQTEAREIALLFDYLTHLGVDGLMLSPAYGYQAVHDENAAAAREAFMTRDEIHEKFRELRRLLRGVRLASSPIYFDFLCGRRELACAAWANPTYNVCGWKGPCYLVTDRHYASYRQLVDETNWDQIGPGHDPRCEHCLVHCGFEPAAVFAAKRRLRDVARMAVWQMT
jgi:hopanoid biosynthesis associated radical SAM protein HpnH